MSRRRGARARSSSCCCRTTASTVDRKLAARVAGIDVILTGHTHDALPEAVQVGKTLLVASGSHGKFLSRLDLDVQGGAVRDFRYRLIPLFADVIAPDAEMAAAIAKARAPFAAELAREVGRTESLLYRRGNFDGTFDDLICAAIIEERDAEIALSPGFRWGTSVLPGAAITVEDIHNATAITYPQVYRMTMTGARLKEILEDVADNLFNPDPYYQQGGDMVRCGGLGYTIDRRQADGQPHLRPDAPEIRRSRSTPRKDYTVAGWASVNEGTEGPPVWELVEKYVARKKTAAGRAEHGREGGRRVAPRSRHSVLHQFPGRLFLQMGRFVERSSRVVLWERHERPAEDRRAAVSRRCGAAPARRWPAAGARRQSEEPAAQRAGMDPRARRRRRGAALRQAVEA